jgi:putative hydrolase of the HAD superfamily
MKKYLLWDFDGTLAHREGMWSAALVSAINKHLPDRTIPLDAVRPHLVSGFPWHTPEIVHHHTSSDELWWAALAPLFQRALTSLDIRGENAVGIVRSVRTEYLRKDAWRVIGGAPVVLRKLSQTGWSHAVISNHVPELPHLVESLGLHQHFERIFCSAHLGVEKPNPGFLDKVFLDIDRGEAKWVIGDSVTADIGLARAAGLQSILVGKKHSNADHCVSSLAEIPSIVGRAIS